MRSRDIIVGLLFFSAIGVALYFAVTLRGAAQLRMPWDARDKTYTVRFPHVGGLGENASVWVSGVPKGQVRKMYVDGVTGEVEVTITLDEKIVLREDCSAEIISSSAFGGRTIAINIGSPRKPELSESKPIQGTILEDIFTQASRSIGKIDQGIDIALDTLKDVNAIIKDVRAGRGPVGTVLYDEKVADDIAATTRNIREMSEDGKNITRDISDITSKVNKGDGTAALLLNDPDLAQRVKNTVKNVEDTADNAASISRSGRSIASKIDEGKGLIGMAVNDEETAENAKSIVRKTDKALDEVGRAFAEVADIAGKANRGEGTLGKIVNDDTLYNDLLNGINTLRAGFEDLREQAPITTFASLLFQLFQ